MTKNWTYCEGKGLISIYANRKEEYFKTRNKKHFWENILTDLESLDVLVMVFFNDQYELSFSLVYFYSKVSPTTVENVEVKWRSLYRAYKNAKDRGTGTSATKFMYISEMDEIFHNDPAISSQFSVSVGVSNTPVAAPMRLEKSPKDTNSTHEENDSPQKKTKNTNVQATNSMYKKEYYEKKIELKKEKN